MNPNRFFVSGIGTEVGKTVVSAILVKALQADYWKPVQAGDLLFSDSMKIAEWVPGARIHQEAYRLQTPMSPHAAADIDGIQIDLNAFELPATDNSLIVEGAGGLLVPLNEKDHMLDLIERLKLPVILVSRHYLGSINHTLLSLEALKARNIPLAGLIFNGKEHPTTERIIQQIGGIRPVGRIEELPDLQPNTIVQAARQLRKALAEALL